MIDQLYIEALDLLKVLISTPSFSKEENQTADIIAGFLQKKGLEVNRHFNNIWVIHPDYQSDRPTLLLNSHHDTVKPSQAWTVDPFVPTEIDGKLIGLGSNDAGAPLVSLMATFLYFCQFDSIPYNLIFTATARVGTQTWYGPSRKVGLRGDYGAECVTRYPVFPGPGHCRRPFRAEPHGHGLVRHTTVGMDLRRYHDLKQCCSGLPETDYLLRFVRKSVRGARRLA